MRHLMQGLCLAAALAMPALAQQKTAAPAAQPSTTVNAEGWVDGEVRRVDKQAGKLTLRHGEIKNLDMPPMTMVFAVKDTAMLDRLRPGDRVHFRAVNEDGQLTVTAVTPTMPPAAKP